MSKKMEVLLIWKRNLNVLCFLFCCYFYLFIGYIVYMIQMIQSPYGYLSSFVANPCGVKPCKNGAKCINEGERFKCVCTVGFMGVICIERKYKIFDSKYFKKRINIYLLLFVMCPNWIMFGLFSLFNSISTFMDYLMPKPFLLKNSSGTF